MTGKLSGRTAVITGSGDGIGKGMALRIAQEGASVVIAELDETMGQACAAEIIAKNGHARFIPVDVSSREAVMAMMAQAGAVDILVNNAWRSKGIARIENKDDAIFEASLHMALYAAKWTMEAALPYMKAQTWGRVINIASLNGVNAHMGSADYNVAKEAMRAYTRTAAREWAPWGICCNVICPAAMAASTRRIMEQQPGMVERISAANPMRRLGDPETDIGGVAAFLASEDARYLTGNTLFVDGGAHINGVAWAPEFDH